MVYTEIFRDVSQTDGLIGFTLLLKFSLIFEKKRYENITKNNDIYSVLWGSRCKKDD